MSGRNEVQGLQMRDDWPFDDPPNTTAITTRHVLDRTLPIPTRKNQMRNRFLKGVFCGGWIVGTSVLLLQSSDALPAGSKTTARDDGQTASVDKVAEAGAMFQKNCISCHQPPDLKFATDRAWLDQLNRTA